MEDNWVNSNTKRLPKKNSNMSPLGPLIGVQIYIFELTQLTITKRERESKKNKSYNGWFLKWRSICLFIEISKGLPIGIPINLLLDFTQESKRTFLRSRPQICSHKRKLIRISYLKSGTSKGCLIESLQDIYRIPMIHYQNILELLMWYTFSDNLSKSSLGLPI